MNDNVEKLIDKAHEGVTKANIDFLHVFKDFMLFSWSWWVTLGLTILPWVVWLFYRKRESTSRLMLAGLFVFIIASYLDFLGVCYGVWRYYAKVIPTIPGFAPYDFSIMPVAVMMLIQSKPQISPIWKGLFFALVSSFVAEPILVWASFYNPLKWEYIYSFPIQFVIYLIADWISRRKTFAEL